MAPPILPYAAAFRWTRRSERPLLTAMNHLNKVLEGTINTTTRLLGRPTYAVHGRRLVVKAPFYAGNDAGVPTVVQAVSLQRALQKTIEQAGAKGTTIQLKLHRVRQPQLDAKILADLIARNVSMYGASRVIGAVRSWIPAVRPEATGSLTASTSSVPKHALLPGYITGFCVTVKGIGTGDPMAQKDTVAWGSYAERPGSLRDFALTRFRGPNGACSVKVVLQMARAVDSDVPRLAVPS